MNYKFEYYGIRRKADDDVITWPRVISAMIYTTLFVALKLRWIPPTVTLLGSAPIYCVVHCAVKIVSLPFGARVSNYLDDVLYAGYQSLTTLCFDLLSGVRVSW